MSEIATAYTYIDVDSTGRMVVGQRSDGQFDVYDRRTGGVLFLKEPEVYIGSRGDTTFATGSLQSGAMITSTPTGHGVSMFGVQDPRAPVYYEKYMESDKTIVDSEGNYILPLSMACAIGEISTTQNEELSLHGDVVYWHDGQLGSKKQDVLNEIVMFNFKDKKIVHSDDQQRYTLQDSLQNGKVRVYKDINSRRTPWIVFHGGEWSGYDGIWVNETKTALIGRSGLNTVDIIKADGTIIRNFHLPSANLTGVSGDSFVLTSSDGKTNQYLTVSEGGTNTGTPIANTNTKADADLKRWNDEVIGVDGARREAFITQVQQAYQPFLKKEKFSIIPFLK